MVPDRKGHVRVAAGRDHLVGLSQGEAHRLLHEDVEPAPRGRDRGRGVRRAGQDHDGIEVARDELAPVREVALDAVRARDRAGGAGREVADGRDLEPVAELAQVVEMHDLGDEAAADHTDAYPTVGEASSSRRAVRRRYGVITTLVASPLRSRARPSAMSWRPITRLTIAASGSFPCSTSRMAVGNV